MCSKGLAKFILFASNFFLFIAGGLLLGFGIAAKVDPAGLTKSIANVPGADGNEVVDVGSLMTHSATFMIAVGCFLFIFCFLGCFGGCCEITWMLFVYWVALLVIIVLQIALIIFAAVSPGKMKEEGIKFMWKRFMQYKPETVLANGTIHITNDPISLSFFGMQSQLECCGVEGKVDYEKLKDWDKDYTIASQTFKAKVPPTCCIHKETEVKEPKVLITCMKEAGATVHALGCYDAVEKELKKTSYIPIIVCVVVIFIELISIAAAIYLWRQNKNEHMSV